MYGAGTEQLLSEHFSTGSTNLSSNSTGMWMSAEQLVKSYHQIKALCTHTLASPRLFGIGLHWLQKHSLPAPQAQNYPPADGHSTCLLQGSTKLFLPPHLHCSLGFSKRKEKLTSVCLTYREWWLPHTGQGREMCLCVRVQRNTSCFLAVPQSLPANTDRNLPFRGSQTGTFLGAAAGCLNSVSFSYGVLFANGHVFNAIDMSTGKQLYLPWRDYQRHKPELDDLVCAFIQNRSMTQFIIRSTSYLMPSSHKNIVDQ